jgi:hypothetical protein
MRVIHGAVLAAIIGAAATPASADVLYDTITSQPAVNSVMAVARTAPAAGAGPLAESFYSPMDLELTQIQLVLKAKAPGDGGSTELLLVPNAAGAGAPASHPTYTGSGTSLTFTGAILLTTIYDADLTSANATYSFNVAQDVGVGEYWLALVSDGSAKWIFETTAGGIGISDQLLMTQQDNNAPTIENGSTGGFFQAIIVAQPIPEPVSVAVLGVGLLGLGISRRRAPSWLAAGRG